MIRGFKVVAQEYLKNETIPTLPLCKTKDSAGYDFFLPKDADPLFLRPGEKKVIWTDVKVKMQKEECFIIQVRSSLGIKYGVSLANGFGLIDSDYFSNPDNDGNIGICLVNQGREEFVLRPGSAFAQGIFFPFLKADNCNSEQERVGGIGSTG